MAGPVATQRRTNGEIAIGNILKDKRPALCRDLTQQPFLDQKTVGQMRIGRDADRGGALETAAFALEQSAALKAEIASEESEDRLTQFLDRLFAAHGGGQAQLPGLQPLLTDARPTGDAHQDENGKCQARADQAGDDTAGDRGLRCDRHILQPNSAQAQFFLRHIVQLGTDRVHLNLAAIGGHDLQRGSDAPAAAQIDGFAQFGQFRVDMTLQYDDVGLLRGIVLRQRDDAIHPCGQRRDGTIIGFQIGLGTGQQIAALPGFGILRGRQKLVERDEDAVRMPHRRIAFPQRLDVAIGDRAAHREKAEADQ